MPQSHVLALIPARSGSKSVPHKNIASIHGKPLISYSIEHALAARVVTRTIVSTDSEMYADIARRHGAEVPFLRPEEFARDDSTDLDVFRHALLWLAAHEGYEPAVCVHLRPTHPVRCSADIDAMVEMLLADQSLDAVRSVVPCPETPFKMWFMGADGILTPVVEKRPADAHNMPRQALKPAFLQNASIDVVRTSTITRKNSMTGDRIRAYPMQTSYDIDTPEHLERAKLALRAPAALKPGSVFCFDIDGVIATLAPGNDYSRAQPIADTIKAVNMLHDAGHTFELHTARGSGTGQDWGTVTREQLSRWGVKYDRLVFGKPAADFYIDDRLIPLSSLGEFTLASKGEV